MDEILSSASAIGPSVSPGPITVSPDVITVAASVVAPEPDQIQAPGVAVGVASAVTPPWTTNKPFAGVATLTGTVVAPTVTASGTVVVRVPVIQKSVSVSTPQAVYDLLLLQPGRQTTVDQEPFGGTKYPFVEPVPVDGKPNLEQLVTDFWLGYERDTVPFTRPLRISWMYGFGDATPGSIPITPEHDQDLEIVDDDGTVVLSTLAATDFTSTPWGGWLKILEWTFPRAVIRMTVITTFSPAMDTPNYPEYFEPDAILDNRTIQRIPTILRGITVDGETVSGRLTFKGRYNTHLTVGETEAPDGGRRETDITWDVDPGLGGGRFGPTCEDQLTTLPLHRLGTTTADARGNVQITAHPCYTVERIVESEDLSGPIRKVSVRAGALQLNDSCAPCTPCEDVISVYEATRKLRDRLAEEVARANAIQQRYEDMLARFEAQRTCREGTSLRITREPYCPCRLGLSVGFCNPNEVCVDNLILIISFQYDDVEGCGTECASTPTSATILANSCFRGGFVDPATSRVVGREIYALNGSWPHYWALFPKVNPHQQAYVTFVLEFPDCESSDTIEMVSDAYAVTDAIGSGGEPPIPGYVVGSGPTGAALDLRLVECTVKSFSPLRPVCE